MVACVAFLVAFILNVEELSVLFLSKKISSKNVKYEKRKPLGNGPLIEHAVRCHSQSECPLLGSLRHAAKLRLAAPVHLQYTEPTIPLVADLTFVEGINPNPTRLNPTIISLAF